MNLRAVDLNLLVALDALLEERHVSRAALRVGMSQPAMSNALARLRLTFGDPLLVRTQAGMEPTPRSLELAEPLRRLLRQAERVFAPDAAFEPATCERRFVIRLSDLLGRLFLPAIAARLLREAPRATLATVHLSPVETVRALEADTCDLAISMSLAHGGAIRQEPLAADRMVCVMRRGHPAARGPFGLARFLALDHLGVSISPVDNRFVEDALAREGHRRRIAMNVPHWLVVPEILRATDLVSVMSARLADVLARPDEGFVHRDPPFAPSAFEWSLYRHRRHESSAPLSWLRGVIVQAVRAS